MLSGYYPTSLETSCIPSRTYIQTVNGLQANNFEFTWNLRGGREILPKIASSFARNLRVLTSKRLLPILRAASQFLGEIFSRFRSQNSLSQKTIPPTTQATAR